MISMNLSKSKKRFEKRHHLKDNKIYEFFTMLVTFFIVCVGLILFRAESIGQAWEYVCGIFDKSLFSVPWIYSATYILPMPFILLVLIVLEWIGREKGCPIQLNYTRKVWKWVVYVLFVMMIFAFGTSSESFIYFQF